MSTTDRCHVVVVGSSIGYFIRPLRRSLEDRTYAEVLETSLHERRLAARVTNSSRWTMLLPEAVIDIEPLVLAHAPDVVVVNFGLVDAQSRTMPMRTFRWLFSRAPSSGPLARRLRRRLTPMVRWWYHEVGPCIARSEIVPRRVPVRRFARELRTLVSVIRHERSALVVLIGISPPGTAVEAVLPGTSAASAEYDRILRAQADGVDVCYVDVGALGLAPDQLTPDGIHFSPAAHRLLGETVADTVTQWWEGVSESGLRSARRDDAGSD